jgi:hypothetical protein
MNFLVGFGGGFSGTGVLRVGCSMVEARPFLEEALILRDFLERAPIPV